MRNICSLITVYKPNIVKLKQNITIMLQFADAIYLLFNSPVVPELLFNEKIVSIDNKKNLGLSKAINKGIVQASADGFQYAILFDQDSYLTKDAFIKMFDVLRLEEQYRKIACIGPSLSIYNNLIPIPNWSKKRKKPNTLNVCSVNNIVTSGMIVNINNFMSIGGFNENYPVDFCDFLFCWKSIYKGYMVLQSTDVYIIHEIGTNSLKLWGYTIHFHAPYRNYFLVRDTLNICFRIKEAPLMIHFRYFFLLPFRMLFFLFILDKKGMRLKMYWLGFIDFLMKRNHFGSIEKILDAE